MRDRAKCPNEPDWSGAGRGEGGRESPPGHDGAKQSQFPPELREGQVSCRKGVMVHRTCNRLRQDKANCPKRGHRGGVSIADCGLRIADSGQPCGGTPPAGRRARGRLYKHTHWHRVYLARGTWRSGFLGQKRGYPSILLFHHSSIPIRCRSCETKPISSRISDCGLGTDLRRDACPAACRLGPAQGEMCETKPILEGVSREDRSFKCEAGGACVESGEVSL